MINKCEEYDQNVTQFPRAANSCAFPALLTQNVHCQEIMLEHFHWSLYTIKINGGSVITISNELGSLFVIVLQNCT